MANTINIDASSQLREVNIIHNQVSEFCLFLRDVVQPGIGTSYSQVLQIPAKAKRLIDAKTRFDGLGFSGAKTKSALENDLDYSDWTATHTSDMNDIITKAATIQSFIESNVANFPASYNAQHQLQYVTASQQVQDDLNTQINSILTHVTV